MASPDRRPSDLEAHGRWLAERHCSRIPASPLSGSAGLISSRLRKYDYLLKESAQYLQAQTSNTGQISSAAEWMLDNYYVTTQALREVQQDLGPRFEHQLPRLQAGHLRIYDLAREIIQAENILLDLGQVQRFVGAYQEVLPLTMGELWALPIMLRLGILECLLTAIAQLTKLPAEMIKSVAPSLDSSKALFSAAQISDQLVVENSIRSLRALAVQDWKIFFESLSLVENVLRQDPAGLYVGMDFDTRDRYRKTIEEIAFAAQADELTIARCAISLAQEAADRQTTNATEPPRESSGPESSKTNKNNRLDDSNNQPVNQTKSVAPGWDGFQSGLDAHVGYFLLGRGRLLLEGTIGYHPKGWGRLLRTANNHPTAIYLGSIAVLTFGLVSVPLFVIHKTAGSALLEMTAFVPLVLFLSLFLAMTMAVSLVNWFITQVVPPKGLLSMDFSLGLPKECAAVIVIPALLSNPDETISLLKQLELHYLRNTDPQLFYALVTDFTDAPTKNRPGDADLVQLAQKGIRELNEKYWRGEQGRFVLLHRERRWNPSEGVWMGWERKRGKLNELNRLIMAAQDAPLVNDSSDPQTLFPMREGDLSFLHQVRYAITLDMDTVLPRDAARELIATMAHPLNRASFGPKVAGQAGEQVETGYTILQPRTDINPLSSNYSYFTRIFSGDTGLDLYTRAVSDVYQDLFGEGIFVGKGIYEVRSFERGLEGRIPENSLLSHDLFEGIHGRVALATSIVLIEDLPPTYLVHAFRLRRWQRGDWQLLPWLFSRRLSVINRWKILDNLRRSLVAPTLLLWILAGWLVLPGAPWAWTVAGALVLTTPILTGFLGMLHKYLSGYSTFQTQSSLKNSFFRWLLALAFLPYEAQIATDAILTTLVRLIITHRGMLRWTTSDQAARLLGEKGAPAFWRQMAFSPLLVIILVPLIVLTRLDVLVWASPLLVTWLLSPWIAAWVSRPRPRRSEGVSPGQEQELRRLARRTWLFFEQFNGPEDRWLPPDRFQEAPLGVVAHHTSPTNIGLALLSALGAYDLGYIETLSLTTRLQSTLDTLEKMERYQGHFLNWYDTRSLEPLLPRYVSTVDSGNLAACLLTLQEGCLEIPYQPALRRESFEGLLDAIDLLDEVLRGLDASSLRPTIAKLRESLKAIIHAIQSVNDDPAQWTTLLFDLRSDGIGNDRHLSWSQIDQLLVKLVESSAEGLGAENLHRIRMYNQRVRRQIDNIQRFIKLLLPWLVSFQNSPAPFRDGEIPPQLAESWRALEMAFPGQVSLAEIPAVCRSGQEALARLKVSLSEKENMDYEEARHWVQDLEEGLDSAGMTAKTISISFEDLARRCNVLFREMDFAFLFDPQRQVFHIGYNVTTSSLDLSYYDLLASEARLASLVAIAKGDVPKSHWLHLGRPFTRVAGQQALISWSGTMFEYLMPRLLVHTDSDTLLSQTLEAVADRQIEYGREKNVPWGISESGYYRFDQNQYYQYRAFGVPGLGYQRGLADDLVITPYASLLALPLRPRAVLQNIEHLKRFGTLGLYGFYEAVDFTPARLGLGQDAGIVRSYMAHHQGMILLSLVNFMKKDTMVRRFRNDPRIQSVGLLLLEQVPRDAPIEQPNTESAPDLQRIRPRLVATPWQVDPQAPYPKVHYLSNGHYSVLVTAAGGGYSTWENIGLTRWRPDTTLDNWGTWIYVQDQESDAIWSASLQPTMAGADTHEVFFNGHIAEYRRRDGALSQTTVVFVAPDDDVEIRRLTLTNHGDRSRRLRLTSYSEVILAPQATDARHLAFNKMFIESEPLPKRNGLLFHRRQRSAAEEAVYLAHAVAIAPSGMVGRLPGNPPKLEWDRRRFLGRNRTISHPAFFDPGSPSRVKDETNPSLDPIFSVSQEVSLPAHSTIQLAFLTVAAHTAKECQDTLDRYTHMDTIRAALERAQALIEVEMNEMEISSTQVKDFQTLLSFLIFPSSTLRAHPDRLAANQKGQSSLWPHAISGDYPILLAEFESPEELTLARELLQAHTYWRRRGLMIDLVFLDKQHASYNQELNSQLYRLIANSESEGWLDRRGGIFLLHMAQIQEADRILVETAARVVLDGARGTLANHLLHTPALDHKPARLPLFSPLLPDREDPEPTATLSRPHALLYDNGLGGFSPDGSEYWIYLKNRQTTPAPWVNVIANPQFGFLTSESGLGTTWAENSGENRLTPWGNDPVSNDQHEAFYLRDEETAIVWSPTPLPAPDQAPYLTRHGAGYTIFEHQSHGLRQQVRVFSPPDAPVKIVQLQLKNTWKRPRRITATYYAEWVLGLNREDSQQYIVPEFSSDPQALLARNPYNTEFAERTAFVSASKPLHGLTADREEFLGRLGSLKQPAALGRIGLSGTVRAGLDPCAALQLHIDLQPGASETVYFLLGQAKDRDAALAFVRHCQDPQQVEAAWKTNNRYWDDLLGTIQVQTPEPAFDLLLNRWLLYQTLSCRIWGRAAFYQSSGAYGFRDQLQDVLALLPIAPQITREHLLRAARHQFEAGDVLHWWHPPSGRGVRTRFSDDLLWLPYVTSEYVYTTGDEAILAEKVPFRRAPLLEPGRDERYGYYPETSDSYTLFEHCRRALEKGATSGPHNLPLMGTGDWNDGMNRVGSGGRGESVWLGWFTYNVLNRVADLCEWRGHEEPAAGYRQRALDLAQAIEDVAWDGKWYLRAFYDDGLPLGSSQDEECQIDSIAQSWAVLSGGGDSQRAAQAMQSVSEHLVKSKDRLVLLFTPPFDKASHDPGYIKGYRPGVRENGGQYTHAAIWAAWAFVELGQVDEGFKIFQFLNPILHADKPHKAIHYRVEPYVVAADIYGAPPFTGQGGWTWYTGSSGWMYRLGIEGFLGLKKRSHWFEVDPHIPKNWSGFHITYRLGSTIYDIQVENPSHVSQGVQKVTLDGQALSDKKIPLGQDDSRHSVIVLMGQPLEPPNMYDS